MAPTNAGTEPPSTRRRVLDAAAAVFARDGLGASMEAVAEAAGVTRMTVYRQLGTRDEVLVALLLDQSGVVVDDLQRILGEVGRPFGQRAVDAVLLIVEAVQASPVLSLFVHRITPTEVGELDRDNRFLDAVWGLLGPYVDEAAARGELRTDARRTLDWLLRQTLLQLTVPSSLGDDLATRRAELELFLVPAICAS
ncbi:MAG: TetR/AcrR family transcriptional regulator [Acidimicrobiales bacterium]|nr:TetR/AcrR family transcriptional regulator [Acidimicrobiales bacterium]